MGVRNPLGVVLTNGGEVLGLVSLRSPHPIFQVLDSTVDEISCMAAYEQEIPQAMNGGASNGVCKLRGSDQENVRDPRYVHLHGGERLVLVALLYLHTPLSERIQHESGQGLNPAIGYVVS